MFDAAIAGPLILSAKVAAATLPLFLTVGVGLGYVLGRWRTPLAVVLDFVVTLPLVFPPIATGFLLLVLLGRDGVLGRALKSVCGVEIIFSFWGVLLAAFVAGLPLVVKTVQAAIRSDTLRLMEVSAVLGKSAPVTFVRVTLPSIRKSIVVGLFLALARTLGEVGITLMLGGNIVGRTNTVSLEIYNAVFTGEFHQAMVLAAILGAASLAILGLMRWIARE
ncbi:MAG: molybdate ABC transporter permease subunit [Desulfovibrionaceae bacterium]